MNADTLRALVAKWRELIPGGNPDYALVRNACADELEAALADPNTEPDITKIPGWCALCHDPIGDGHVHPESAWLELAEEERKERASGTEPTCAYVHFKPGSAMDGKRCGQRESLHGGTMLSHAFVPASGTDNALPFQHGDVIRATAPNTTRVEWLVVSKETPTITPEGASLNAPAYGFALVPSLTDEMIEAESEREQRYYGGIQGFIDGARWARDMMNGGKA